MQKPASCKECILHSRPGPIPSELNGEVGWNLSGDTDVLFISEAPGSYEIRHEAPFMNPKGAGGVLRQTMKLLGIGRFGIINTWKCQPPGNKISEDAVVGDFCTLTLEEEINSIKSRVVAPLGSVGLSAFLGYEASIMQTHGRMFSIVRGDVSHTVLPLFHPAYITYSPKMIRTWELETYKLQRYLQKGILDYIPLADRKVHHIHDEAAAFEALRHISKYTTLACDLETASFNMPWEHGEIISISIAVSYTESYAFVWKVFDNSDLFELLKGLMESPNTSWVWYNGIYDIQFIWDAGIRARLSDDAMLRHHILDERANMQALKRDSTFFLNQVNWEDDVHKEKIPKNKSPEAQAMWHDIDKKVLLEYNGQDTVHTLHLRDVLVAYSEDDLVKTEGIYKYVPDWDYVRDLLAPTYEMLAEARYVGIRMDIAKIVELRNLFEPVMAEICERLERISGDSYFNPNSPAQKKALLHKRGIKAPNTQRTTLEEFAGDEAVDAMLEWSEVHKMKSTYIDGIVDDICDDKRIHPDWRLPTETGRPRCSDPNILGMPRKAEESEHRWKRRIKEMFICEPDYLLMHIDRKQSEVRSACFLSNDEALIKILKTGRDMHGEVASLMYGPDWTKEQRVWAKMVVFGLLYNRQAYSLSKQLKCTVREAQAFMNKFFAQMPELFLWRKAIIKQVREEGELTSWTGRKRHFELITWKNAKGVENEAVNFPPSNLSADLNFMSCVETRRCFGKYGVTTLAPIHDASLLRIPRNSLYLADEIAGMWPEFAQKFLHTDIPFPVDVSIGERWSDL